MSQDNLQSNGHQASPEIQKVTVAHRFLPALVRREGLDIGYVDVIDRSHRHGVSNYGFWHRLWIGILDLAGVWWLIRRKRRVLQSQEITLAH